MTDERTDPISAARPVYEVDMPTTALIGVGALVVGTVIVVTAIDRAQQLLGLFVMAGVLASVLAPLCRGLGRLIGRVAATIAIHLAMTVLIAGAAALVIQHIRSEATALEAYAEVQLEALEDDGGPTLLTRTRLDERLGDAAANWGTVAVVGDDATGAIVARLSELVIITVLSIFFALQGDRLVSMVVGWTDDRERRRRLREVWSESSDRAARHLRRTLLLGAGSGSAAAGLALAFDLPGVLLIGVWAGLLSTVPLLGTVLGWAPITVIALVDRPPEHVLALAALSVIGVAATNIARSRTVVTPVKPGCFVVAMSIAAGLSAAGLAGAAAGMFIAVAAVNAATHDWSAMTTRPIERAAGEAAVTSEDGDGGPYPREDVETSGRDRRLLLRLSRGTALKVTGLVVFAFLVQLALTRVGPTLVWAIVGVLIAIGLDRPVSWIERRWGVRRAVVVVVGTVVIAGAIAGLATTARGSISDASSLDEDIPELVDSLESLPIIGDRLADANLGSSIEEWQRDAPRIVTRSPMAGRAVGVVGGGLVGAFWVAVAALTGLLDGPRLIDAIGRRVPARFSRQTTRLARAGQAALSGYVAGSALVAALNGVLIGVMALIVGVPMAALLALWAFSWNFIPQIGALIGWAPFVVLAFLEGPVAGAVCLLVFVMYQSVENNVIQPSIVGHAVDISALAALGAALVGVAIAGLVGAVLAIPIAGVARALVTEWQRDDFPRVRGVDSAPRLEASTVTPLP